VTADPFVALQRSKLEAAWRADLPGSTAPRVVVALPSYSLDRSVLEHYGARVAPLENRYLYVILRSADPSTRTVYLSSRPVRPEVLEGYLSLAPPEQRAGILERTLLVSPDDVSAHPLAEKLCGRPDLIDRIRRFIGDDVALIEPWNVTPCERKLALALDAPLHGTDPSLWRLATKSGSRRLFRAAGVPLPAGIEDVRTPDEVAAAIDELRGAGHARAGVVVKLDDSVAGDGNIVFRGDAGDVRPSLPDWYVEVLAQGGVVEELVAGDDFRSPSGQAQVRPDGEVEVLSTHDQRLGGPNGQVFEGCSFPADDGYAIAIAEHVGAVGRALQSHGVVGRFAVDFVAVRRDGRWCVSAIEINLRKGGTTHPYGITRLLTGGRFDPATNRLVLPDGTSRCYGATDNLVDEAWLARQPAEVWSRLEAAGVLYDRSTATGVVPHLLDCLAVDGRMGYTAIGTSHEHVADLEERLRAALHF
jgi:hypothetical protein